jgi:hypothetical protein
VNARFFVETPEMKCKIFLKISFRGCVVIGIILLEYVQKLQSVLLFPSGVEVLLSLGEKSVIHTTFTENLLSINDREWKWYQFRRSDVQNF